MDFRGDLANMVFIRIYYIRIYYIRIYYIILEYIILEYIILEYIIWVVHQVISFYFNIFIFSEAPSEKIDDVNNFCNILTCSF
jgi:hypothetical protein